MAYSTTDKAVSENNSEKFSRITPFSTIISPSLTNLTISLYWPKNHEKMSHTSKAHIVQGEFWRRRRHHFSFTDIANRMIEFYYIRCAEQRDDFTSAPCDELCKTSHTCDNKIFIAFVTTDIDVSENKREDLPRIPPFSTRNLLSLKIMIFSR